MKTGLRRSIHASTAVVLAVMFIDERLLQPLVWALAGMAVVVEIARFSNPRFKVWLAATVPVFRPSELGRMSGATALWLGYSVAVFFPLTPAIGAILGAALADPAASLVGGRFGSGKSKSLSGSMAFLLVIVGLGWALGLPLGTIAIVAAGSTLLERFSGPVDDNLLIAPGIAFGLWFLS